MHVRKFDHRRKLSSAPPEIAFASRPTIRGSEYPDNEESVAGARRSPSVRRSCTCFRFPYALLRPLFSAARYVHCAMPDVLPLTYSTPHGPPRASLMTVPLFLLFSDASSHSRVSIRRRCTSRRTHHRAHITVGASGGTASLNRLVCEVAGPLFTRSVQEQCTQCSPERIAAAIVYAGFAPWKKKSTVRA